MITLGPSGALIPGHVLDVSRRPFEQALRDYDSLLYVRWNPRKLKGWGCWEIRRRPEQMTVRPSRVTPALGYDGLIREQWTQGDVFEWEGMTIVVPKYHENDLVNHVLDCSFLNYDQIRRIKEMDVWAKGQRHTFAADLERKEAHQAVAIKEKAAEDLAYNQKQIKREMRDYRELLASGLNPAQLALHWGKKPG